MRWTTHCIDCGIEINRPIKCIRCEKCQREINRIRTNIRNRRGAVRPLGSIDECKYCGKEYVVKSGTQKYCKDCAKQAIRESVNASKRAYAAKDRADPEKYAEIRRGRQSLGIDRVCPICGKPFKTKTIAVYCSDECRKEGKRRYCKAYDAAHREQRRAKWAALTPEQRETIRVNARKQHVIHDKVCQICGQTFQTNSGNAKYCSDKCRKEASHRYFEVYDAARRKQKRARWAALTPEQREARRANARARRAALPQEQREALNAKAREQRAIRKNKNK